MKGSAIRQAPGAATPRGRLLQDLVATHGKAIASRPVISLGSHCYTAYLLQAAGLKHFSTPFDWLFSSPAMIAHCLYDDFATFLDRSFHRSVPTDERDDPAANFAEHSYYRERFNIRHVFNHRDPNRDEDYGYFIRAVERFRIVARSGNGIFLCTFPASWTPESLFDSLASALHRYGVGNRLVVMAVSESKSALPSVELAKQSGDASLYTFNAISRWEDTKFAHPADDVCLFSAFLDAVKN